eukprot:1144409-Pelagomonas_calceolata.AAC.4
MHQGKTTNHRHTKSQASTTCAGHKGAAKSERGKHAALLVNNATFIKCITSAAHITGPFTHIMVSPLPPKIKPKMRQSQQPSYLSLHLWLVIPLEPWCTANLVLCCSPPQVPLAGPVRTPPPSSQSEVWAALWGACSTKEGRKGGKACIDEALGTMDERQGCIHMLPRTEEHGRKQQNAVLKTTGPQQKN